MRQIMNLKNEGVEIQKNPDENVGSFKSNFYLPS